MTLYKQLLIFTLTLCLILFFGVWAGKLHNTRDFLVNQMASHAQDTATSLGISLSPFVAVDDSAAVETLLNAVFDRGYYRAIILTDMNGATISIRTLPVAIENVPSWFISLIPLETPQAQAFLMAGWKKAGTVYVESHPGYAYLTLWKTVVLMSTYFIFTGFTAIVLGGVGLRFLLRPLRRVEHQAEAICRREYELQDRIPRTRELRRVVETMNKMTRRVKEMFEEQATIADKLRAHSFGDSLTGLGNRRFLSVQIRSFMAEDADVARGVFQIIKIHNLDEINKKKGYGAGDELLKRAAQVITETMSPYAEQVCAHLTGGDFAVFVPNADQDECRRVAKRLTAGLARLAAERLGTSTDICSLGAIFFTRPLRFESLLAEADTALSVARLAGPNQWHCVESTSDESTTVIHGKTWWRHTLNQAMADEDITLYGQRVVSATAFDNTLHLELFCRITGEDGTVIPASVFVPAAENSTQVTELDLHVLAMALKARPSLPYKAIAVNVSTTSLCDEAFVERLFDVLKTSPPGAPRLLFEFPEFTAAQNIEAIHRFGNRLHASGHGIGIDHFGRSFCNFGYLKSIHPDYVKIDAAFTRELQNDGDDSYFFIGALTGVAHSLSVKVIAEGVENETQYRLLKDLKIDGLQGFFIDKPHPLTETIG